MTSEQIMMSIATTASLAKKMDKTQSDDAKVSVQCIFVIYNIEIHNSTVTYVAMTRDFKHFNQ